MNYREFLTSEVKFKKVVDFSGVTSYAYPSSADSEAIPQVFNIEEKIRINYRLQYLKDTVMARYIDDLSMKTINQLISKNNKDICTEIFFDNPESSKSVKDLVIEKVMQKEDMLERSMAIEFMIELC